MTGTCTSATAITSGGQITGLVGGTNYYVKVTATASSGYLSSTSAQAGPQAATTQLNAPTNVTLSYGATSGSISVTFTAPSNAPGGQTYSAKVLHRYRHDGYLHHPVVDHLGWATHWSERKRGHAGQSYYVQITANASTGYLAATSAQAGPQAALSSLNAPTSVAVSSSTATAGAS